jgi:hypothetical protein
MISASGTHSLLLYGRLDGISDSYTGRCHILDGAGAYEFAISYGGECEMQIEKLNKLLENIGRNCDW